MRYFIEDHLLRFGYLSAEAEVRLAGKRLGEAGPETGRAAVAEGHG
jgi:hypothetical protein